MYEVLEINDSDAYAAYFEDEGDWDVSDLTGGPDLGHCVPIRVADDQVREVRSISSPSLPESLVHHIHLVVRSDPSL